MKSTDDSFALHPGEAHRSGSARRLNWLRAGVLGANDGIVSTSALVVGIAGATNSLGTILTAGVAGLAAGAVSMALGEYVSVSSQRDSEISLLAKERKELAEQPEEELAELAEIYRRKGLSRETAKQVAEELTQHDAFTAHAEAELGITPGELTSPWQAAAASALSFTFGAALPLIAITVPPEELRVPVTFIVVILALILTGTLSALLGGAKPLRATVRMVVGGVLAMAITFGIGQLFGTRI